jgi:plastocyanin
MTRNLLAASVALMSLTGICWAATIAHVDQKNLSFSVPKLSVRKGSIVDFTNSDSTSHNILVTGQGLALNSGLQAPGVSFKAPLMKEGTYQVICGIHPKMKMTVVVQ